VALATFYGRAVAASGPVYESMTVEGSAIRLQFQHADGLTTTDGQPPRRFTIAGEDRKFVAAEAKIDGSTVIVSSPQVLRPVAVRYAFVNDPVGVNLTNASGLPAAPFRTDTWPGSTDSRN
jgi:sialate O-acetylesterase